jgi:peptide/nickel transport system substrate-binding protein
MSLLRSHPLGVLASFPCHGGFLRTRIPSLAFLALLASLSVGACRAGDNGGGLAESVPEAERYGGTAVVGAYGDLQSMNGLTSSDYNANSIQRDLLFMPLVKYDENRELVPWLAERWEAVQVSPDSIEVTWYLRRDIRWHDGQPTTAHDVVFTFDRMVDPRTAFPNHERMARYSRNAQLVDDYTVRMRLSPHSEYLDIWYFTPIMPRHILGDVPPDQLLQHPFQHEPVGNGPFRFVRRVPGQEWIFEANPDFTQALGGRPYLDRVVWRYIPEMTTLLTELLTGRIDLYVSPNPNQAEQIRNASGVRLIDSPSRQWNYFAFNTRRPQFQDARVRRAIGMAINRQQIVDALVFGYGDVGRSTVTPAHWSYDADDAQTMLPHDPEQARRLLAEAGWTPGPDGMLRNAEGTQLRFTPITNAGNDLRRDILEIMQAQLRPLGIVVEPRQLEWTTFIATLQDRRRNFDALVGGWVDYFQKDDTNILHSRNLEGPYQYVGYSNPRVDALLDQLIVITDRQQAEPLWREYQRLIVQESPYIVLYYPRRINGVRTRLQNVEMDIRGEFPNVTRWWIAPRERRAGEGAGGAGAAAPADTGGPAPADTPRTN